MYSGEFFCLGGGVQGGGTRGIFSMEKLVMGLENFNEGGAGFCRQLGLLPRSFFSNLPIKTMRKPFSQKINM